MRRCAGRASPPSQPRVLLVAGGSPRKSARAPSTTCPAPTSSRSAAAPTSRTPSTTSAGPTSPRARSASTSTRWPRNTARRRSAGRRRTRRRRRQLLVHAPGPVTAFQAEEARRRSPGVAKFSLTAKAAIRKGAPFAGYTDFADCVSKNSDKGDPDAYCGYIKHRVEDGKKKKKSSLYKVVAAMRPPWFEDAEREITAALRAQAERPYERDSYDYVEGPGRSIPRDVMQHLWRNDPDGWSHREPTDADRDRFYNW